MLALLLDEKTPLPSQDATDPVVPISFKKIFS